jgi:S1-C subfamily serine protease
MTTVADATFQVAAEHPAGSYIGVIVDRDLDLDLEIPDDALRAHLGLPKDRGLVTSSVRTNGPAWAAGVRENDVLLTLDGVPLAKPEDLEARLKQAGDKTMTLSVIRKRKPIELTVQPEVRVGLGPARVEESSYWIGLGVSPIGPALRAQLNIPDRQGLVVASVVDDGPASKCGLKLNDVVLTVAGKPQADQQALGELVRKNGDKPLDVVFLREGARREATITPEKRQAIKLTFKMNRPTIAETYVRPGVLQNGLSVGWTETPGTLASYYSALNNAPAADASAKRIDEMAAEIKELHKAIDALRKAVEERK